jgi:predicted DNA binding protein
MKAYKGIVKGKKVHFDETANIRDGSEVLVLLKPSRTDDEEITKRQLQILKKGYKMGEILYTSREELHER